MTTTGTRPPSSARARTASLAPLVGALLLAAATTGCGATSPATREDGLAVASYEPTGTGGDAALLTGVVEDLDGCLVVTRTDAVAGQEPFVPVFASTDDLPGDVAVGEPVELGGGEAPGFDETWTYPSTCPAEGPFWIVAQPE